MARRLQRFHALQPQRVPVRRAATDDDATVHALIATGGALLAALAKKLADGSITKAQFIAQARALLTEHAQKAASVADADLSAQHTDRLIDGDALDGYADDIQSGDASDAQIAARAALWLGTAWVAYQIGRTLVAPEDAQWTWICHEDEASCDDCTANADGSPYTRDTLPGYPADGSQQCLGNCRCHLARAD